MTEYTLDFSIAGEYKTGGTEVTYWQFVALMAGADSIEVDGKKITRDDAPFIIVEDVIVERGGPGSGHHGHAGRPGEVGGSLPSGVGSIDVPKFTDKQQGWVDWALGGMDDPEVYENPFPTIEEAINDPDMRRGLLWRLEDLAPDLASGAGYDQEGIAALSSARAAQNAAKKIRDAVEDYRQGLLDLSSEDVLSIVGGEEERFWGFVDAVLSRHYTEYGADQEARWKEARSDWIENWQYEKHGMGMDEGREWLDSLDRRERYQVYDDLIQMHFNIYEGQDKEEIIPQVSRRFPNEFMEVLARHLDVIERGGPGSGHHGHRGRPGEVGGSLPSGASAQAIADIEQSDPIELPEFKEQAHNFVETRPWERSAEEFANGEVPFFTYDPKSGDPRQWAAEWQTDKIELRPRFFEYDEFNRASVIYHEIGHDIARTLLDPDRQDETFEALEYFREPYGQEEKPPLNVHNIDYHNFVGSNRGRNKLVNEFIADLYMGLIFGRGIEEYPDDQSDYAVAKRAVFSLIREAAEELAWPSEPTWKISVPKDEEGKEDYTNTTVVLRGGPGSGHHDHAGRPGKVGGSLPSGGGKGRHGLPKRETGTSGTGEQTTDLGTMPIKELVEKARSLGGRIAYENKEELLDFHMDYLAEKYGFEKEGERSEEATRERLSEKYERTGDVVDEEYVRWVLEGYIIGVEQGIVPPDTRIMMRRPDPEFPREDEFFASWMGWVGAIQNQWHSTPEEVEKAKKQWEEEYRRDISQIGTYESEFDAPNGVSAYFDHQWTGTIIHELGHEWNDEIMGYKPEARAGRILPPFVSQNSPEDQARRDFVKKWISWYAASKAQEMASECYALSKHPDFQKMPETTKKIVNYVVHGEGSPDDFTDF